MMELFTLGADRGAYTQSDVRRERPRAHRLVAGSVAQGRRLGLRLRPEPARRRPARRSSATRATGPGRTPATSASTTRCIRRSSSRSSGATSSRRRSTRRRSTGLQALYADRRDPAGRRGDPDAPRLLHGPAHGQAARRLQRRPAADARASTSTTRSGGTLGQSAGQQLFYPPDVGGWDYTRWLNTATFRARWFMAALVQGTGTPADSPSDPDEARRARRSSTGATRPSRRRPTNLLAAFAKAQLAAPEPAPRSSRRRCGGSSPPPPTSRPHELRATAATATAPSFLRRAVAEAGRGLPGIEPGMPLPAGHRAHPARRSSRARAGLALAVYGGGSLSAPRARRRDRPRGRHPDRPARTCSSRSSSPAASTALSVLFPAGDPGYYQLRPNLGAAAERGHRLRRRQPARWNPAASEHRDALRRGQGLGRSPAIGYADSDLSHFTSRHYWEVGATDADAAHGLARPLPRRRSARSTTRCRA